MQIMPNLADDEGPPSEETLSAARLAMRTQRGVGGGLIASITPRFLLVPPALETQAEKLLTAINPVRTEDVNVFQRSLTLVVEPRLKSDTRWYLVASPEMDGLEFAYLAGQPGPQIESQTGFRIDGVEMKVRLDYGAGFIETRGWYMNEGAAS